MDATKYAVGYYPAPGEHFKWVHKDHIEKAPQWCSVDLRDGNQSLVIPMSLEEKLEFYKMLLKIGFKEIEVGFPAASETEYTFLRTLIEQNMIPQDVTVQVLTQCREHIIRKTFEACKGAPSAIIHFYNSTSVAQREQVFKKSREEIKQIAVDGAKLVKKLAAEYEGNFRFEYSPESFTGTEPEYALEVCNAVLDVLEPSESNNVIINLPVTVQKEMGLTYLFVAHDLSMVKHISDRVAVMYLGQIVEITRSEELYSHPLHPYTQALLSAIPIPDPIIEAERETKRIHLEGEVTSPIDPAPGCRFASRCPYATARCKEATPTLKEVGNGHEVACFRVTGE